MGGDQSPHALAEPDDLRPGVLPAHHRGEPAQIAVPRLRVVDVAAAFLEGIFPLAADLIGIHRRLRLLLQHPATQILVVDGRSAEPVDADYHGIRLDALLQPLAVAEGLPAERLLRVVRHQRVVGGALAEEQSCKNGSSQPRRDMREAASGAGENILHPLKVSHFLRKGATVLSTKLQNARHRGEGPGSRL